MIDFLKGKIKNPQKKIFQSFKFLPPDKYEKSKGYYFRFRNFSKIIIKNKIVDHLTDTKFFQNKKIYIEGHFESEKYFIEYRNDILKEFNFKNKITCNEKYYQNIVNSNSISLVFRSNRFTEKYRDEKSLEN